MPVDEIDYLEERGPGIPELPEGPAIAGGPGAAGPAGELAELPGWEQATIEQFLRGTGAGMHMLIGAAERDWLMVAEDLDRIAPPLTRICNRWEPAMRLSPVADPLLVIHGLVLYVWRSLLERHRAARDAELEREELAGARYEPGGEDRDVDVVERQAPDELDVDLEHLDQPGYFDQPNGGSTHDEQ